MNKLKKQQPQKEAAPAVSLADRIRETCAAAEQYIESKVDALKSSDEGRQLPRTWLELNLRATTRGGGCNCKVALQLLESDNGR
jgi:hypothetical protein